jgi:hypothetical protein
MRLNGADVLARSPPTHSWNTASLSHGTWHAAHDVARDTRQTIRGAAHHRPLPARFPPLRSVRAVRDEGGPLSGRAAGASVGSASRAPKPRDRDSKRGGSSDRGPFPLTRSRSLVPAHPFPLTRSRKRRYRTWHPVESRPAQRPSGVWQLPERHARHNALHGTGPRMAPGHAWHRAAHGTGPGTGPWMAPGLCTAACALCRATQPAAAGV